MRRVTAHRKLDTAITALNICHSHLDDAWTALHDWTDSGYPGPGSSGRRGHGDPTGSTATTHVTYRMHDPAEQDLRTLTDLLATLERTAARLERIITTTTNTPTTTTSSDLPAPILCANWGPCTNLIDPDAKQYPDGLCPRCYRHWQRYGLPYPRRHVIQKDGRTTVIPT